MAMMPRRPPARGSNAEKPKGEVDCWGNVVLKGEKKPKALRNGNKGKTADEIFAEKEAASKISAEEARRKFTGIDAFEGIFDFLSPEAECDVAWEGRVYRSAAHAFLAAQFPRAVLDIEEAKSLEAARKATKGESESDDWAAQRLKVMEKVQRDKFRRSADFRKRLADTGDRELLWENDEDAFWGATRGKGQNQLGKILMDVRESLANGTEFDLWLVLCCEMETEDLRRPPIELLERKSGEDGAEQKKVHRLSGSGYFKFGKLPASAVQALHPSVSREHAILVHSRAHMAKRTGGVVLVELGSKAGTSLSGRKLPHAFLMEPVRNGDTIVLGASTREYVFKVNLKSQIEQLEAQERELMREVKTIDADAANPIEAAKRAAREEATIFVGSLDFETEKADLLGLFQDCGHIQEVRFPGQEATKATRGIAFVVFDDSMAARRACGLNGELFKGRKVKVTPANQNRPAGADGDGKGKSKGKGKGKDKDGHDDRKEDKDLTSREIASRDRRGRSRSRERRARSASSASERPRDRRRAEERKRRSESTPRREKRSRSRGRRGESEQRASRKQREQSSDSSSSASDQKRKQKKALRKAKG